MSNMIYLILYTILFGTAIWAFFDIRYKVNHVFPPNSEEHKRMEDMLARWKMEGAEAKKKERLAYLNSDAALTEFKESHRLEHESIDRGEIPHYIIRNIYSPEVRRKEKERQRQWDEDLRTKMEQCTDEKEHEMLQLLVGMKAPSSLGLNLTKNPNTARWDREAEARAMASIGTIFEWMACEVMHEPQQEKTFHLIRTSGEKRWIYLTLTREKTESVKEILDEHLMHI